MTEVVVLVMSDGRGEYLERTMISAADKLDGRIDRWLIHEDSGDRYFVDWVCRTWPQADVVATEGRSGFGGAIRNAWRIIAEQYPDCGWVFHLEADFVFNRPVDIDVMRRILDRQPHLAQVALRRQAWNQAEIRAGGVVELQPGDFIDVTDGSDRWLEHNLWFTTNPSMYRRSLLNIGWPEGDRSEGVFSIRLRQLLGYRFAYLGERSDPPWVHHIGTVRAGVGY